MQKVPTLSLKKYISGTKYEKKEFVKELYNSFKEYGFVVIENHSINEDLLNRAYKLSKQLFDLPIEKKLSYFVKGGGGQRGYTPFGTEKAKDSDFIDLKEFWHVGREFSISHPDYNKYPKNIWPEVAEFKETFIKMYFELDKTGAVLLEALGKSLGVKEGFLSKMAEGGNSILRLLHYPPIPKEADPRCIRAEKHGDINYITLLVASAQPGLQLLTKQGTWLDVESNPNNIIVNIGDMLSRITNDELPSTIHRVINPKDGKNESRYSMPFFVHPRSEVVLSCLDSCKGNEEKYPPISAGDFLNQRLKEIGLKK